MLHALRLVTAPVVLVTFLMGSVVEAIKGAQIELTSIQGSRAKAVRLLRLTRIFAAELLGSLAILPYGVTAFRVHRMLQPRQKSRSHASVTICRDVSYGSKPRTVMDIYIPGQAPLASAKASQQLTQSTASVDSTAKNDSDALRTKPGTEHFPVALFCHGGVWATGSKWHYAPMARQLAQAGVVTCVIQYSLYPDALAPQMVDELSQSLTWTFSNIRQHGGNPGQVSLVGHSAGAQMCAMALLHRAQGLRKHKQSQHSTHNPRQSSELGGQSDLVLAELRMPARFIGIAGVYDIETHYQYEYGRGVAELSTMKRAMGGRHKFPSQSPALILNSACGGKAKIKLPGKAPAAVASSGWKTRLASLGKAVQGSMPGFMTAPAITHANKTDATMANSPVQAREVDQEGRSTQATDAAPAPPMAEAESVMSVSLEEAAELPPVTLMSSTADIIVPWQQSEELHQVLQACSLRAKHHVYSDHSHADFVTDWTGPPVELQDNGRRLPGYHKDLVEELLKDS